MHAFHEGPLDKKFAHKQNQENVFVQNLRRAIPGYLESKLVEKVILPKLSPHSREIFLEYYIPHHRGKAVLPEDMDVDGEYYILFNIPHTISASLLDSPENPAKLTLREKKILLTFYKPNPSSDSYVLKRTVSELEEKAIEVILDRKDIRLTDGERIMLAEMLEGIPEIPGEEVYYAGLLIDPTHDFFFEHPNEHVPGIMLLEAARQFAMACWHVFGKVPFKGVQFILSNFNSNFFDFVELNYPAGMKARLLSHENGKTGEWSTASLKITIFQKGEICAEMQIDARVIGKKLFHRLREGKNDSNPSHRFYPLEGFHCQISLWNELTKQYIKASLWDISHEGFRLEIDEKKEDAPLIEEMDFLICFEVVGFIRGKCVPVWHQQYKNSHWAGYRFTEISQADRKNLKEAIRRFCRIRSERDKV